jgi:hypothetical protein
MSSKFWKIFPEIIIHGKYFLKFTIIVNFLQKNAKKSQKGLDAHPFCLLPNAQAPRLRVWGGEGAGQGLSVTTVRASLNFNAFCNFLQSGG